MSEPDRVDGSTDSRADLEPAAFHLQRPFEPAGDQPQAIESLTRVLKPVGVLRFFGGDWNRKDVHDGQRIANLKRPALVLSHNKTLAALYSEFKEFFPENAVHYFVSYYDYYQPEAYIPQRDVYIEKDSSINEEIDRLRLATTSSLVSRRDVVIVASVSSIYGLGSPKDYKELIVPLHRGERTRRDHLLLKLVDVLYERNDVAFERGKFRVRGDSIELWPSYEEFAYRIEMWGDEIEQISIIKPVSGETIRTVDHVYIYPARHFVMPEDRIQNALRVIRAELAEQLELFQSQGKARSIAFVNVHG